MSREIILAEVRVNGKASESFGRKLWSDCGVSPAHCSNYERSLRNLETNAETHLGRPGRTWDNLGVPGITFEQQRVLVQRNARTILAEATVSSGGAL